MNRVKFGRRTFGQQVLATAAFGAVFTPDKSAWGGELTAEEKATLHSGQSVTRNLDFDINGGVYQGGLAYHLANVPAAIITKMLTDVSVYSRILALTLEARDDGKKGTHQLVYLKHGGRWGTAAYTLRVAPIDNEGVIRFWMDPAFAHEVEDLWGFVRVESLGAEKSLVTYAVLCDLGSVIRLLFGERVRRYALQTAGNICRVAAEKVGAAGGLIP
ncbi:MAG: hypothetical protein IPK82_12550 [Polyangiaceae bacterium]|nr:hypothetical protein [Polyangiaceae bacterium]